MKRFFAITLCFIMILSLAGCGSADDGHGHGTEPTVSMSDMWDSTCHTEKMTNYLNDSAGSILTYATGTQDFSKPLSYHFSWNVKVPKGFKIKDYTFVLSLDPAEYEVVCKITTTEKYVDLDNLLLRQMYFWTVYVNTEDGGSYPSNFMDFATSNDAPRVLNVPGVTNCRDLGGWPIEGRQNTYVKQGMIIRTGRMNDNKKDKITITEEGIKVLRDELGVRTEIDLRQDEIRTESALGSTVSYVNIPMSGNDVYKNQDNLIEGVKQIFTLLSDEKNYPVQIHCSVGADRTGYICFLINGLLGVGEENLYRDYLFSNFGKVDGMRKPEEITDSYVAMLKKEAGDSLSEKIYNYLIKIGVSAAEIESVRTILTEER